MLTRVYVRRSWPIFTNIVLILVSEDTMFIRESGLQKLETAFCVEESQEMQWIGMKILRDLLE